MPYTISTPSLSMIPTMIWAPLRFISFLLGPAHKKRPPRLRAAGAFDLSIADPRIGFPSSRETPRRNAEYRYGYEEELGNHGALGASGIPVQVHVSHPIREFFPAQGG